MSRPNMCHTAMSKGCRDNYRLPSQGIYLLPFNSSDHHSPQFEYPAVGHCQTVNDNFKIQTK